MSLYGCDIIICSWFIVEILLSA